MSSRSYFPSSLILMLFVALLPFGVSAQEITGSILGTVKDSSGALVPGATINILNTDKKVLIRTATSDATGEYTAPLLPIGNYSITVSAPNFKETVQHAVLNVNDKLTLNFTLEVGPVAEQVTVESGQLQVELQTPTAAGLISGTQVRELSLNNRNYEQ